MQMGNQKELFKSWTRKAIRMSTYHW